MAGIRQANNKDTAYNQEPSNNVVSNYFKVALRKLLRSRVYAAINLAGLALAMASSILIFLYVQDERSYDTYHDNADQLYRVVDGGNAQTPIPLGPTLYRERPEVLNYVGLAPPTGVWVLRFGDKTFYESRVFLADETLFEVFTFPLLQGDPQTALQDPFSIVISEAMAHKYFGEDDPVGQVLIADDGIADLKVTGVMQNMPSASHFKADFFVPSSIREELTDWDFSEDWYGLGGRNYTYILLQQGYAPESLVARFPGLLDTHVDTPTKAAGITFDLQVQPLTDIHLRSHLEHELDANGNIIYLYLLAAIAFFILLIACFNFMNLSTARTAKSAREVGIRKVVGAQRSHLIQQFLGESVFVSLAAVLLALLIVALTLPLFNVLAGKTLTLTNANPGMLLLGLIGMALLVGLLSGSYPAFFLSAFRPIVVLKGSVTTGRKRGSLRRVLVVVQFAISIGLMAGTVVLYEQLSYIQQKNLGFNKEQVVLLPSGVGAIIEQYEPLKRALLQEPRILSVSAASFVPGRSAGGSRLLTIPIRPDDGPAQDRLDVPILYYDFGFNETFDLALRAGRFFSSDFALDRYREALIVNETAAQRLGWATPAAALGKQIDVGQWFKGTIVGVVKDFHIRSLHHPVEPVLLMLIEGNGSYVSHIALRISPEEAPSTLAFMERTWTTLFPDLPFAYSFLDEEFARLYQTEEKLSRVYSAFALMAIVIACLGLFGLASFMAEQRTKEIGIRKVLGASPSTIIQLLIREFLTLVVLANVLAWPVAYYFMNQWLENFAYHVTIDWGVFLLAGLSAFVIAVLTVSYQSIKAALANPVEALRYGE